LFDTVTSRLKLWRCARVGEGVRVLGRVWVHGGGRVELGQGVVLDARAAPIELRAAKNAVLELKDGCVVMGGASLEAEGRVTVGPRARVGPFAKVLDSHFHPLTGDRSVRPAAEPVVIEQDVVLEPHAIILPGAYLEAGSVVAERAVVAKRVPKGARATGNPARIERVNRD
jgi:acetyltransferase-like isoleucine patch superfamily enzyme